MKKTFAESQIVSAVKRTETVMKTSEVARELGVNYTTIINWKSKYSDISSAYHFLLDCDHCTFNFILS
jgi:transposase